MSSPHSFGDIRTFQVILTAHVRSNVYFCRMIILAARCEKSMKSVARLLLQPSIWVCILITTTAFTSILDNEERIIDFRSELENETVPLFATSPGHTVFGEYVGAHWCPPCMSSSSPSLSNLKASNPEEFTYVSFFESSGGGWPNDAPIGRQTHIMQSSSGYPTFSFADRQSGSCYKIGATGTNYYDSDFTNGGCMNASANDFQLELSMSLNSSTEDVSIVLKAMYVGSEPSFDVHVYGAVTEKIGADSYDNGVKPHHNWRGWLLNEAGTGFQQLSLVQGVWSEHTWVSPLSLVRAGGGNTQWENFWPVLSLMDGPHTSYNEFYVSIDPDMGPMIDVGISSFNVENQLQTTGFIPGDILDLSVLVTNNGVETYSEGGNLGVYLISGSDEIYLGGREIGTLGVAGSMLFDIEFDTSNIELIVSGATTFRTKLVEMGSDRNSSNNMADGIALHDLPPTASQPAATSATSFERGDEVQFETTALPNDLVDDINTMIPVMEYSKSGLEQWESSWVSEPELVGSGANSVYIHTIQSPPNAESGSYDTRIMWEDSAGQQSDWLITSDAFELRNALPRVLGNADPGFAGLPTVKVDTLETVSLFGLVRDAETPLSMLSVSSEANEFKGWNPATSEITVLFESIQDDQSGNPIPQGVYVSIDDGEDVNNGMLQFNVIENGAPRWSPIPTQTVFEGGSASTTLTGYLTDFDNEGNPLPATGLELSIVSNSNEGLVNVTMIGHTISATTVDEDNHGIAEIAIMANDGEKSSQTSLVFFVINVNDAPTLETSNLEGLTLKSGEVSSIELAPLISDVDDPSDEVWVDADSPVPGAVQFDYINSILNMSWEEPGEHSVKLTLIDSHGDWNMFEFIVTVLDSKPITWEGSSEGDLQISLEGLEIGNDPTITISNVGNVNFENVDVRWSICNGIVGICHSAGSNDGLGPFQAISTSGSGLSMGDYITLSVKGVDTDGWERGTVEPVEIKVPTKSEPEITPSPDEDDPENEKTQDSGSDQSGFSGIEMLVGVMILILFIGGGTMAGLYFSGSLSGRRATQRKSRPRFPEDVSTTEQKDGHQDEYVDFEEQNAVPEKQQEQHPPIPEDGLPEGWTIEQWKYYGEEWLKRQN